MLFILLWIVLHTNILIKIIDAYLGFYPNKEIGDLAGVPNDLALLACFLTLAKALRNASIVMLLTKNTSVTKMYNCLLVSFHVTCAFPKTVWFQKYGEQ